MHPMAEKFYRDQLKDMASKCNSANRLIFNKMYSPNDFEQDINITIDNMDPEKLDWAMHQLHNTLIKKVSV